MQHFKKSTRLDFEIAIQVTVKDFFLFENLALHIIKIYSTIVILAYTVSPKRFSDFLSIKN